MGDLWLLIFVAGIVFTAAGVKCKSIAKVGTRKWGSEPWQWSGVGNLCFAFSIPFAAVPPVLLLILAIRLT